MQDWANSGDQYVQHYDAETHIHSASPILRAEGEIVLISLRELFALLGKQS